MRRHPFLLVSLAVTAAGCMGPGSEFEEAHPLPAGVLLLTPPELRRLERPAVAFAHDRHTRALGRGSCQACHPADSRGRLSLRFGRLEEPTSRHRLLELYHDRCLGCHDQRTAQQMLGGPLTCGECHRRGGPATSGRKAPRFDLALHFRHVTAEKQACQSCHHVFDETARKLVYRKGSEEACTVCHGEADHGSRLSLRRAAHRLCVGCHLERTRSGARAGPTTCEGCHGGQVPAGLERPAATGRLLRGQRDRVTIAAPGARGGQVVFDHLGHEKHRRAGPEGAAGSNDMSAGFCTDCHHRSLSACRSCHPLAGSAGRGGGHNLEAAFHHASSSRSCVGCHRRQVASSRSCAGCHQAQGEALSEQSCRGCHQARPAPASLPVLPAPSHAFPDKVVISSLLAEYGPSTLPHQKIVVALDAAIRKSRLATAFHGSTAVLCAGCHHRSPVAERPPPCRSCHGATAVPATDRPVLQAAYHRQCLGCHVAMGLKQGCTDCHAKREGRR